jgi:hypothetical protein
VALGRRADSTQSTTETGQNWSGEPKRTTCLAGYVAFSSLLTSWSPLTMCAVGSTVGATLCPICGQRMPVATRLAAAGHAAQPPARSSGESRARSQDRIAVRKCCLLSVAKKPITDKSGIYPVVPFMRINPPRQEKRGETDIAPVPPQFGHTSLVVLSGHPQNVKVPRHHIPERAQIIAIYAPVSDYEIVDLTVWPSVILVIRIRMRRRVAELPRARHVAISGMVKHFRNSEVKSNRATPRVATIGRECIQVLQFFVSRCEYHFLSPLIVLTVKASDHVAHAQNGMAASHAHGLLST